MGMGGKVFSGTLPFMARSSVRPASGLMIIGRRIGGFALNDGEGGLAWDNRQAP
jgi:hypothetical protein